MMGLSIALMKVGLGDLLIALRGEGGGSFITLINDGVVGLIIALIDGGGGLTHYIR